jgi:hypothetical protein
MMKVQLFAIPAILAAIGLWAGQAGAVDVSVGGPASPNPGVHVDVPALGVHVNTAPAVGVAPDQWRYKWDNNRWWYWAPDNRWMVYSDPGGWTYYQLEGSYTAGYGGVTVAPSTTYAAPSTTYVYPSTGYYYGYPGYYGYGYGPGVYIRGGWGWGWGGRGRGWRR